MIRIDGEFPVEVDEPEDAADAERDWLTARIRVDWPSLTAEQCRELARQLIEAAEAIENLRGKRQ